MERVSRSTILLRGLKHRCPQCGRGSLFTGAFTVRPCCGECGLSFERGEGFFLGSMALNYGMAIALWLVPVFLLWLVHLIGDRTAAALAIVGAIGFPVAFYRSSRSWWLAIYFVALPQELPANQAGDRGNRR